MNIQQLCLLFYHLVICFCPLGFAGARNRNLSKSPLSRSSFPDGFIFGAASSAYQSEGAAKMYGRGPSIWDIFTEEPGKIVDNSNADVADDFYHRYKEDISLMKEVGLDSFRISFSWSRILPKGKISGGVNWEGVGFYNTLVDVLLENGIQPLVTLLHWDFPQALEDDYKGPLSPQIVDDFRDYANFCFKEFGDRVKFWATVNEPNLYTIFAYAYGEFAPGRCSDYIGNCTAGNSATEPYIVVHHLLLSHATAVKLYKENYQASQNGKIGLTVSTAWMVPKFETVASVDASSRALDFLVGWIMHPLTYGDYPKSMRYLVGNRLPSFTDTEAKLLKGSFDFIGMNYYTSHYADNVTYYNTVNLSYTTDSRVNITYYKNGVPIGEPTTCSWLFICPKGIREMLLYLKRKYNNPVIYVTENGFADNSSLPLIDILDDITRIKYHRLHLLRVIEAIKEGVDVRGYYVWSFLDDFEWNWGYTLRFGLTYVDYKQGLERYPKRSSLWFKEFLVKDNNTESYSLLYSE